MVLVAKNPEHKGVRLVLTNSMLGMCDDLT